MKQDVKKKSQTLFNSDFRKCQQFGVESFANQPNVTAVLPMFRNDPDVTTGFYFSETGLPDAPRRCSGICEEAPERGHQTEGPEPPARGLQQDKRRRRESARFLHRDGESTVGGGASRSKSPVKINFKWYGSRQLPSHWKLPICRALMKVGWRTSWSTLPKCWNSRTFPAFSYT